MAQRSIRTQERDRDVCSALELLGAPSHDAAADLYMPPRLDQALRNTFFAGMRHASRRVVAATEAARKAGATIPIDDRREHAAGNAKRICRTVLAMSDPPPPRHVAYFTEQLRRALAAAWEAGAEQSDRHIAALERATQEAAA